MYGDTGGALAVRGADRPPPPAPRGRRCQLRGWRRPGGISPPAEAPPVWGASVSTHCLHVRATHGASVLREDRLDARRCELTLLDRRHVRHRHPAGTRLQCAAAHAGCSFPELAAEAAAVFAARLGRDRPAQERWRRAGALSVAALQHSCYYLTGVAELIYFEQFCGQLFNTSPLCQWQWLLIVGLLCLPVLQVPSFHATRFAALVFGVAPLILNVAVFLHEVLLVRPRARTARVRPCADRPTRRGRRRAARPSRPLGVCVRVWRPRALPGADSGDGRSPRGASRDGDHLMAATTIPLYWLCGVLGYYAYGDFSRANINLNFPNNAANQLSIGVQAAQELFFVLDSNLVVMLAIELAVGLDPSACAPGWRGVAPWVGRLMVRTAFLASQVFCAQMLLSGEGDTLLSLQGLTASVGMVAFTYFLPYVFYAILSPRPLSTSRKVWAGLNVVLGMVVMVAGFGSSLAELLDGTGGMFNGKCRLPYAYAPMSPLDPCNISGLPYD